MLDQRQALAQDFAGVLVATVNDQLFDELGLMVGQDDISSRHAKLLRQNFNWHTMPAN